MGAAATGAAATAAVARAAATGAATGAGATEEAATATGAGATEEAATEEAASTVAAEDATAAAGGLRKSILSGRSRAAHEGPSLKSARRRKVLFAGFANPEKFHADVICRRDLFIGRSNY
jgi:hypothetical protein